MTCYHRYAVTDDRSITFAELVEALTSSDSQWTIDGDLLMRDGVECAMLDVTRPGDPIRDGDLDLLTRFAEKKKNRDENLPYLMNAKALVTVTPLCDEDTLLQPLWGWLAAHRAGLWAWEGGLLRCQNRPASE